MKLIGNDSWRFSQEQAHKAIAVNFFWISSKVNCQFLTCQILVIWSFIVVIKLFGKNCCCTGGQTWPFLLAAIVSVLNHLATIAYRILETLLRAGATFDFRHPVSYPSPLSMLVHYRDHAQIIAQQHWKGRGYLGELATFLWEEAILTLQEWIFGKGVSTTLQVTCIYAMKEILTFGGGLNFCELQSLWCTNHFNHH